ncbi:Acyl-coenzyme A thioesterase 13 [Hypsizygus marmoreus]|uniref:Acyl-coenzyme A thioesterase 13 n=1 Tax=Hypsizygus marmoreus TaxID=39966 RepID=A0A369JFA7_HYPMA|nr:Acyl-coenzyme A thioesterase 13 [Hypsizygus marmoreus]
MSDIEDEAVARIAGNASEDVKRALAHPGAFFVNRAMLEGVKGPIFGETITNRMVVTEVSVEQKKEEPSRLEGKVVCELTVEEDMINGGGNIHGGCSAFLIDICSTLALTALSMSNTGDVYISVSQSLNIVYHSPAALGDKLRIVNTTMTLGARAHSARTEIWNATHHRLVSSGVHIKMQPSFPKSNL